MSLLTKLVASFRKFTTVGRSKSYVDVCAPTTRWNRSQLLFANSDVVPQSNSPTRWNRSQATSK